MPDRIYQPCLGEKDVDPLVVNLAEVTFVVLDLETTGGAPDGGGITEIGAVKVRGGKRLGEFTTLVNPGTKLPPFITALTGITDAMLAPAPSIAAVLPSLLEFLGTSVLVAHNASFDVGFLKAACAAHGYPWPRPTVLDTVALARRVLVSEEVRDRKLATLASYFGAGVRPNHRALDDASATTDVLYGLIARLNRHGVRTLGDAVEFIRAVSPAQRRKRSLADGLPHVPGVYLFRGADEQVLYVGTSRDIAARVRAYFTAAERRNRIKEMLIAAERVDAIECAHALEAQVREVRLIAAHAPPYNRRSNHPHRTWWLKLTTEPYPRLAVVRAPRDTAAPCLGPFRSRQAAEQVATAFCDAVPLRQCAGRLAPDSISPTCARAELARCLAPCRRQISPADYAKAAADLVRDALVSDPGPIVSALQDRLTQLADGGRYEDAATARDRFAALLRACIRSQRRAGLTKIAELCAARPVGGGWELAVVRCGRLAGAGYASPGTHPRAALSAVRATAETVLVEPDDGGSATAEETDHIASWLERPDTRLVEASSGWASPARGAARFTGLLARFPSCPPIRVQ